MKRNRIDNLMFNLFTTLYFILCYLLYQELNLLLYMTIPLLLIFKYRKLRVSAILGMLLILNFLYIIDDKYLVSPEHINEITVILNKLIVAFTNFALFVWIYYNLYFDEQHMSEESIIKDKKIQYTISAITIIAGGVDMLYNPKILQLPIFFILVYSTILAFILAKTFSKDLCLWLSPLYLITLLFSFIVSIILYTKFIYVEAIVERHRYLFNFNMAFLFNYQITTLLQFIFLFLPRTFFRNNNEISKKNIFLIVVLLEIIVLSPYISIFSNYFN